MIRMSFSLRRCSLTLGLSALLALPGAAFAEEDASSSGDATAVPISDAGSATTADTVSVPDVSTVDVPAPMDVPAPADTTSTTKPFNSNPCWDVKCAKETAACIANANCVKYHECKDKACQDAVVKADKAAVDMAIAIANCGYKACNDPTKGTCKGNCGKFLGDNAPCNCDDACKQYNDCCADMAEVCKDDTCADKCGEYDKAKTCQCDDQCMDNGDCCKDFEEKCPVDPVDADGGSTGKDGSSSCSCGAKQCGDDGCGKPCGANQGKCPGDGLCSPLGKCIAGSGSSDTVGGTADSAAPAGDASTVKDAGTSVIVPLPAPGKSSGCTTSASGGQGAGLWLGLGMLCAAIFARRRFA